MKTFQWSEGNGIASATLDDGGAVRIDGEQAVAGRVFREDGAWIGYAYAKESMEGEYSTAYAAVRHVWRAWHTA